MSDQYEDKELEAFTSLFQNAAVARDYVRGNMTEEDINELAAHIFFIKPTYRYDTDKQPIDNVFSAYKQAVAQLITQKQLALLDAIGEPTLQDVGLMQPDQYEGGLIINAWYKNRIAELTKQKGK